MFDYTPPQSDYDFSSTPMPSMPGVMPVNYSPYVTAAGGAFGAASQLAAGQTSAALLRANARIAGMQATGQLQAGSEQAALYRQHLDAVLGKQAVSIGASNLTMSGSPLRSMESTSYLGAQDISRIQTNAARKAWGFDVTEQGDLAKADIASSTGKMNALGSLITTGAKAFGQWSSD